MIVEFYSSLSSNLFMFFLFPSFFELEAKNSIIIFTLNYCYLWQLCILQGNLISFKPKGQADDTRLSKAQGLFTFSFFSKQTAQPLLPCPLQSMCAQQYRPELGTLLLATNCNFIGNVSHFPSTHCNCTKGTFINEVIIFKKGGQKIMKISSLVIVMK